MKTLVRGQKAKLADIALGDCFESVINLSLPSGSSIDVSCFGLDATDKLSDDRYFIFFNQRKSPEGAISAAGAGKSGQETFALDLSRLPATVKKLVFTATIDGAATMAQVHSGSLRLMKSGEVAVDFPLIGSDYSAEKAIILGEIYLKDVWRFAAVGQGFNGGLSALLKHFGGEEITPPAASAPAPPPLPVVPPPIHTTAGKVSLSKVTLTKAGQSHSLSLEKGPSAPRKLTVKATWTDNGDDSDDNDDLDLRVGILLADGRMKFIQAPDRAGNFDSDPFVRHLGDITSASAKEPATETVDVNPSIAQRCGGRVALVFSVYSALANGAVSVASMHPIMRMVYGQQVVECAFDFSKTSAAADQTVYTYVIGLAIIDGDSITLQPSGRTSDPGSENTPWLKWESAKGIQLSMNGPAVFKSADASSLNKGNPNRYV